MSETTYLKELVVVEDGIAYKFKGVSLSNSNASTILDNLISEYTEQYNNLNAQVTALENQLELGQVKFVTDMTTLNTEPLVNTLYVNNEVVGIVDDGSGIIPQVYLSDGSSVSLKEVERKEEDPDDGNEYLGYVNKQGYIKSLLITVNSAPGASAFGYNPSFSDSTDPDINTLCQTIIEGVSFTLYSLNIKTNSNLSDYLNVDINDIISITRLDNGKSINLSCSNKNDESITFKLEENISSAEDYFFTENDVNKTIQFKIEKVS